MLVSVHKRPAFMRRNRNPVQRRVLGRIAVSHGACALMHKVWITMWRQLHGSNER